MANPYAPPGMHDAGYLPPGGPTGGGPQPWELGEVITQGWETLKRQPILAVALFIMYMIPNVASVASSIVGSTGLFADSTILLAGMQVSSSLFAMVVSAFLQVGLLRMQLVAARGEEASLGLLFSGADRFLPMIGYSLLSALLIMLGFVLFIIPGVILSLGFALGPYYLVDQQKGVVDSLKSSWEATSGNRGDLFLFGLVSACLILLGLCACVIGVFGTASVVMLALAVIYLRRAGQAVPQPATAALGPGTPNYGTGPGGYPPGPAAPPGAGYPPGGMH